MSQKEYEIVDDPDTPAGRQFEQLANDSPRKAARLLTAVEDFAAGGLRRADRVAPLPGPGAVEVYLVPPRYVLSHLPDAAALIRVIHQERRIEFVEIVFECGGPGYPDWARLEVVAQGALVYP